VKTGRLQSLAFPSQRSFLSNRELVLDDPQSPDWAEFQLTAAGYGIITNTSISVEIPAEVEVTH